MKTASDRPRPDAPLRLSLAAKLAVPDGSMTASGLRPEAARGRLHVERIAGKDDTTLESIKRMRELCRVQAKEPDCTNEKRDTGPKPDIDCADVLSIHLSDVGEPADQFEIIARIGRLNEFQGEQEVVCGQCPDVRSVC
jgi:hypothetical protein